MGNEAHKIEKMGISTIKKKHQQRKRWKGGYSSRDDRCIYTPQQKYSQKNLFASLFLKMSDLLKRGGGGVDKVKEEI